MHKLSFFTLHFLGLSLLAAEDIQLSLIDQAINERVNADKVTLMSKVNSILNITSGAKILSKEQKQLISETLERENIKSFLQIMMLADKKSPLLFKFLACELPSKKIDDKSLIASQQYDYPQSVVEHISPYIVPTDYKQNEGKRIFLEKVEKIQDLLFIIAFRQNSFGYTSNESLLSLWNSLSENTQKYLIWQNEHKSIILRTKKDELLEIPNAVAQKSETLKNVIDTIGLKPFDLPIASDKKNLELFWDLVQTSDTKHVIVDRPNKQLISNLLFAMDFFDINKSYYNILTYVKDTIRQYAISLDENDIKIIKKHPYLYSEYEQDITPVFVKNIAFEDDISLRATCKRINDYGGYKDLYINLKNDKQKWSPMYSEGASYHPLEIKLLKLLDKNKPPKQIFVPSPNNRFNIKAFWPIENNPEINKKLSIYEGENQVEDYDCNLQEDEQFENLDWSHDSCQILLTTNKHRPLLFSFDPIKKKCTHIETNAFPNNVSTFEWVDSNRCFFGLNDGKLQLWSITPQKENEGLIISKEKKFRIEKYGEWDDIAHAPINNIVLSPNKNYVACITDHSIYLGSTTFNFEKSSAPQEFIRQPEEKQRSIIKSLTAMLMNPIKSIIRPGNETLIGGIIGAGIGAGGFLLYKYLAKKPATENRDNEE